MLNKLNITKRDIILNTICTIIASLIFFVLGKLFGAAPIIGTTIISTISNLIFTMAAQQTHFTFTLCLYSFLLGVAVDVCVILVRLLVSLVTDNKKEEKKSDHSPKQSLKSLFQELEEENKKERKKLTRKAFFCALYMFLFTLFLITTMLIPISLADSFERDITFIRPYVKEETVQQLQSDWVDMRSKADYDAIYSSIKPIKKEHSQKR